MAKPPPKRLDSQSNQRTRIYRHVRVKRTKKLQQQSSQKTEATEVNAIMDKLDESNGKGHRSKNNINHFSPIYESYNKEGTDNRTKLNPPTIVLSEKEKGRENKGGQNKRNEKYGNDRKKNTTAKVYDTNSDRELNGDFIMEYHYNNSDTDEKYHIPRAKGQTSKKKHKNKPPSLTVKETSLKATPTKDTNGEYKYETMDNIYNKK